MAFPLLAVIGAALSEHQSRQAKDEALQRAGQQNTQNILQTHARSLGGSPYAGMNADLQRQFLDIAQQSEASRNNNIGTLLQAYLKKTPEAPVDPGIAGGGDGLLGGGPGAGGFNAGMGGSTLDPWDKDPWGDAGF